MAEFLARLVELPAAFAVWIGQRRERRRERRRRVAIEAMQLCPQCGRRHGSVWSMLDCDHQEPEQE